MKHYQYMKLDWLVKMALVIPTGGVEGLRYHTMGHGVLSVMMDGALLMPM